MKKILAITVTLIVFLCSILTGCANTGGKGNNVLWIGALDSGFGLDWLIRSIERFETKYPEYEIVIHESDSQFSELAKTRLDTDKTVNDLLFIYDINPENYSSLGKLVDISDVYMQQFGDIDGNTIESALLDGARMRGKSTGKDGKKAYFSVPLNASYSSFILNRNVSDYYESLPNWGSTKKIDKVSTVADLNKWVERIMTLSETKPFTYLDGSGSGKVMGFTYPGQYIDYWTPIISSWWVQYSGYPTYQNFFAMENASVFNDQGRLKAYEAFESLDLANTSVEGSMGFDHINSQNAFVSGKCALIPNGEWIQYESRNSIASWGVEIEMLPIPYIDSEHKTNVLNVINSTIAIIPNRADTNIELAKKFLSFVLSKSEVLEKEKLNGSFMPYYNGYDKELDDNMETYSEFSANIMSLRDNADVLAFDVPTSESATNWKILLTGTANKFCIGLPYSDIIEGRSSPKDFFDNEVKYAEEKFPDWLTLCGLGE